MGKAKKVPIGMKNKPKVKKDKKKK